MGAQPADEVQDIGVAPHPGRKAAEAAQRLLGVGVRPGAPDVPVDPVGVGPVPLDRHGGESELVDQPLRDAGTLTIELVRPVAGLAEQHDPRVTDELQQGVVVAGDRRTGAGVAPHRLEDRRSAGDAASRSGHPQAPSAAPARGGLRRQVRPEPVDGQPGDDAQGAGLLEQVAGALDDARSGAGSGAEPPPAVELRAPRGRGNRRSAGWRPDLREAVAGQVRPSAARDDRAHRRRRPRPPPTAPPPRRSTRRSSRSAVACRRVLPRPPRDRLEAAGEQRNVEDQLATVASCSESRSKRSVASPASLSARGHPRLRGLEALLRCRARRSPGPGRLAGMREPPGQADRPQVELQLARRRRRPAPRRGTTGSRPAGLPAARAPPRPRPGRSRRYQRPTPRSSRGTVRHTTSSASSPEHRHGLPRAHRHGHDDARRATARAGRARRPGRSGRWPGRRRPG